MKNSILKRLLIVFAMVCLILTTMTFVVAASAEVQTGIDLVILLDSSKSMSDSAYGRRDGEYKRLDAAVMMINMCDNAQSRVAVVPFTDHINANAPWSQMVDISDVHARAQFCDQVINCATFASTSGTTSFAEALGKAYELLNSRQQEGSTNKPVVLLLSDGVNEKSGDQSKAVSIADSIKNDLGADVYCVYLGSGNTQAISNLTAIAGSASEHGAAYVQYGADSEMVGFFSEIFAKLIDSRKITTSMTIENDEVDIPINVPNNSVYEINLVFPMNIAAKNTDIQIFQDGDRVSGSDSVYYYEHTGNASTTRSPYDYFSLKLIKPAAGTWHIKFKPSDKANGVTFSYDVLYNYDVNLAGSASAETCYLNQDLVLNAWFVKTDGSGNSSDEYMYNIPASYEIKAADGTLVLQGDMEKDGLGYTQTISAEQLHFALGENVYQTYTVSFHAEDQTMYRDSINEVAFTILDAAPESQQESVDLGLIRIADVLDPNGVDGTTTCDVSPYFASVDGDALTYAISGNPSGIQAELDGAVLTISKAGDETVTDGWVNLVAIDPRGNSSAPVCFFVDVLSVRQLVEECVSIELTADKDGIHKGETIQLTAEYRIAVPEGADSAVLPYCELDGIVTDEALRVAATDAAGFNFEEAEGLSFTENGYSASLTAADLANASTTVSFSASIGGVEKTSNALSFTVTNAAPTVNVDALTDALTEDLGGKTQVVEGLGEDLIFFDVDRDEPNPDVLGFSLGDWFTDTDTEFGGEALNYSVEIQPIEETKDIFSLARSILRIVGLADKSGEIVTLDGAAYEESSEVSVDYDGDTGVVTAELGENGALKLNAMRFGNAIVTVRAQDNSGESVSYSIGYHVTSSQEQFRCLIVYAIMLLILIIIIIILINKLIIHAKWPNGSSARYEVILNGYNQISNRGEQSSKFNKTGRKAITLRELARQFDIQDGGSGNALFSAIRLWPTTGGRIVVEAPKRKPRDAEVLVDGKKLGTKAKWGRGSITCKYKDSDGVEHTCVFKRV